MQTRDASTLLLPHAGCVVDNTGRLLTCGGLSLDAGETRRFEIPVTTTALGTLSNTAMVFVEVGSPPPVRTVVIEVIRTCLNYNSDGSRYPCNPGTEFNTQNAANTAPDQATCCQVCWVMYLFMIVYHNTRHLASGMTKMPWLLFHKS